MAENLLQLPRAAAAALQFYPSHDGEAFKFLWPGNEGYSSIVWRIGPFFFLSFFFFHFACHTLTRAFISALCKFIHISFGTSIVQSIHPPQKAFQQNITFLYSGASMFYAVVQILRIQPGDPQ